MDDASAGDIPHLVLVGAGHSQIEVLRLFGMNPMSGARKTLVSRDYHAPYSGMLPGLISGHYTFDEAHINVAPLARFAGVRFIHDEVARLDLKERVVHCTRRPPIHFDYLSVNIGSRPTVHAIPGAAEYAVPVKPVDAFLMYWSDLINRLTSADEPLRVVTVGGGAGGVELALSMQYRTRREREQIGKDPDMIRFAIVNGAQTILPTHNARVRSKMERALSSRGIEVTNNARVVEVTESEVRMDTRATVGYDALIWVTEGAPQPWVLESGLATDDRGFIEVDETLRSTSHPFVFATGDISHMTHAPRPKSGVFAVRQGPYLASNIRRTLRDEALERYEPQSRFLSLISTGDQNAIASRGPFAFEGEWVWRWKDRIDRAFVERYDVIDTAGMGGEDVMEQMRCGGCGSKVGSDTLTAALRQIDQPAGEGVVIGLEPPDDAAVVQLPSGTLAVQSVDFFRSFIDDPYVLGKVTAHHCLTDLYAMGATPHTALAIATIPYDSAGFAADTLTDLLKGSTEVLNEAGATLVGGHTTEGSELAFGLSVHGYVAPEKLLRKSGMQAGDKLVVTKAIGTGVIFAGEMQGVTRGHWVEGALESMLLSNKPAMEIFQHYGIRACTDVTGFGIVAHLSEMTEAANRDVELDLDAIPVLEGAAALSADQVRSTLYPENVRHARVLNRQPEDHPVYDLLFDPQTSGGLIAAIPADMAEQCVEELRNAGYGRAAIIGEATEGTEGNVVLKD